MEKLIYGLILFFMIIFIGCGESSNNDSSESESTPNESETENTSTNIVSGHVLDGPCLAGANVNIKPLNSATLAQKPDTYLTTTSTDFGYFEVPTEIDLEETPYAHIKVSEAECHNEVTGGMMEFKTYYALVDLTEGGLQNVSPQTTGVIKRIIELHTNPSSETYQDFAASKTQAEQEWMLAYGITGITTPFSEMGLDSASDGNAALLAMNAIHLRGNSVGEQAEMIANMADDIEFDGTIDDIDIINEIKNNSQALDWTNVRDNLTARYQTLGYPITAPNPEPFADKDGDGLLGSEDDDTPDPFSFVQVTDSELNTEYTSNEVTISGLSETGTTQITGTIFVNDTELTDPAVENGDVIKLKITSSVNYSRSISETITMDGIDYTYSVTSKDDDRQQIIIFDSGQPSQDGDFGLANAQTWCDNQAVVNGLTGTIEPLLATDSDLMAIVNPDSTNPRKVQSLWGGLVSSRWAKFLVDEGLQSFEDLGIVDTSYWAGRVVEAVPPNCDGWTSNGNGADITDFGYYYLHDIANRSFQGDPRAIQNNKCDYLRKILCIAH